MAFSKKYRLLLVAGHILFWLCSLTFALWAFYEASDAQVVYSPLVILRAVIPNIGFAIAVYVNLAVLIPRFLKRKNYIFYTFWLLITMAVSALIIKVLLHVAIDLQFTRRLYSSFFFTAGVYIGVTSLAKFVTDWLKLQDISLRFHKVEKEKLEAELKQLALLKKKLEALEATVAPPSGTGVRIRHKCGKGTVIKGRLSGFVAPRDLYNLRFREIVDPKTGIAHIELET